MKKQYDFSYSIFKENEIIDIGLTIVDITREDVKNIADLLILKGGYMPDVSELPDLDKRVLCAANKSFITSNESLDLDWDLYSVEINQKLPLDLCIETYRYVLRDEIK